MRTVLLLLIFACVAYCAFDALERAINDEIDMLIECTHGNKVVRMKFIILLATHLYHPVVSRSIL